MTDSKDPRGMLSRAPRLANLRDEKIDAAVRADDGVKLFALLRNRRRKHPDHEEAWIDELLRDPLWFWSPVKKAPSLATVNGVGARLLGSSDVDAGGSYVSTLYFTFLFVPLVPLARYVVRTTGSRSYQFLAKVPLSASQRGWRVAAALTALTAVLTGIGAAGFEAYRTAQVTQVALLNGLDFPVKVTVDGAPLGEVPAQEKRSAPVTPGVHHFAATRLSGDPVDSADLQVPRWKDLVAFNVLGSAPLYLEGVVYAVNPKLARDNQIEPLGGQKTVVRDGIGYVFRETPETTDIPAGGTTTLWTAQLAEGGWRTSLQMLEHQGQLAQAAQLASAVAELETSNVEAQETAVNLALASGGAEAALKVAAAQAAQDGAPPEAQFRFESALIGAGQRDQAKEIFAGIAAKHPEDAFASYLALRAAGSEPSTWDVAAKQFPNSRLIRGTRAGLLAAKHDWKPARAAYEALGGDLSTNEAIDYASALHATGENDRALEVLARATRTNSGDIDLLLAYGALVPKNGGDPRKLLEQYLAKGNDGELQKAYLALLARGDTSVNLGGVKGERSQAALELIRMTLRDPNAAMQRATHATQDVLERVDGRIVLLLAAEAVRTHQAELAHRLVAAGGLLDLDLAQVERYLADGDAGALRGLPRSSHAAVALVRARALLEAHQDPRVALAELDPAALYDTPIALAVASWVPAH